MAKICGTVDPPRCLCICSLRADKLRLQVLTRCPSSPSFDVRERPVISDAKFCVRDVDVFQHRHLDTDSGVNRVVEYTTIHLQFCSVGPSLGT